MQARLGTIVCKFGRDPAICLVEEAICAKSLQTDGRTDGQTDAARSHKLIPRNELKMVRPQTKLTRKRYLLGMSSTSQNEPDHPIMYLL